MDELIERLAALTGPDRELDLDIGIAVLGWKSTEYNGHPMLDVDGDLFPDHPGAMYPAPTESIDAALTLVPEGWEWALFSDSGSFRVEIGDPKVGLESEAPTAAIALCIAALKARNASETPPETSLENGS